MKRQYVQIALVMVMATALLTAGCTPNPPRFIDEGADYSADQVLELPLDVNAGAVAGRPVAQAEDLRSDTLAALRREGDRQAEIAALITRSLPLKSRGVPFYIELATVDSVDAVIVIEAIGRTGGTLEDKRVWVLDTEGRILLSGTR